jgi:WD40 repeat protein
VGWSVTVGPDGNPVVTGILGLADGGADYVTAKFASTDGERLWLARHPGAVNNIEARTSWLAQLDGGDVVMGSRTWSASTGYDVVLHRYAAATGATVWTYRWNSGTNRADDPRAMIRDAAGNLLVCGVSGGDYFVLKVDGVGGQRLWNATYHGPPNWWDTALVLAEAPDGTVVTSGLSDGATTGWDVATVGFDPTTGAYLWDLRRDGSGQSDEPRAIAASAQGDLFVTGYVYGYDTQNDLLTLCYRLPAGTTPVIGGDPPAVAGLTGAWPNPFNPRVTLSYALPADGAARLAVFDLRGREVAVLVDGASAAGTHVAAWDGRDAGGREVSAGVYLAVLRTEQGTTMRRLVLAK